VRSPISSPPLDHADRAEDQGEDAPEADKGRVVQMPDHEHLEQSFRSASKDAKTHHHSHELPG